MTQAETILTGGDGLPQRSECATLCEMGRTLRDIGTGRNISSCSRRDAFTRAGGTSNTPRMMGYRDGEERGVGGVGFLWRADSTRQPRQETTCRDHLLITGEIASMPVRVCVVYMAVEGSMHEENVHLIQCRENGGRRMPRRVEVLRQTSTGNWKN